MANPSLLVICCPAPLQFSGQRSAAPQVTVPEVSAAKDAFFAARSGYSYNRVRAKSSTVTY